MRVALSRRHVLASSSATARAARRLFALPCARVVLRDSARRASLFRAAMCSRRLPRQGATRVALSRCCAHAPSSATAHAARRSFAPPCARAVFRDRARRASLFRAAVRLRRLPRQRMPRVALSRRCAPAPSSATAHAARRSFAPPCARAVFRDSACRASLFRAAVRPRGLLQQRMPRVALSRCCAPARSSATARAARRSFALPRAAGTRVRRCPVSRSRF